MRPCVASEITYATAGLMLFRLSYCLQILRTTVFFGCCTIRSWRDSNPTNGMILDINVGVGKTYHTLGKHPTLAAFHTNK